MKRYIALAFLTATIAGYLATGAAQAAPIGPGSAAMTVERNTPLVQQAHWRPWSHCQFWNGRLNCHSMHDRYLGLQDPYRALRARPTCVRGLIGL